MAPSASGPPFGRDVNEFDLSFSHCADEQFDRVHGSVEELEELIALIGLCHSAGEWPPRNDPEARHAADEFGFVALPARYPGSPAVFAKGFRRAVVRPRRARVFFTLLDGPPREIVILAVVSRRLYRWDRARILEDVCVKALSLRSRPSP